MKTIQTEIIENQGFLVMENSIPKAKTDAVLRRIYEDVKTYGLSCREMLWWKEQANWFPHLREDESIKELEACLPNWLRQGKLCEPQILLGFPEAIKPNVVMKSHIDQEPPWANGKKYLAIVGVPLTPFTKANGGVTFWPFDGGTYTPELKVGDSFVMHPNLPHSGGPNNAGGVRHAVYFRYLEE